MQSTISKILKENGYRLAGYKLTIDGYSRPIVVDAKTGLEVEVPKPTGTQATADVFGEIMRSYAEGRILPHKKKVETEPIDAADVPEKKTKSKKS